MRNVYFDTETTSLMPGQICQLSYIVEENMRLKEVKNYFFTVDSIDEGAQKAHGLTLEFLEKASGGLRFKDVHEEIYKVFNGSRLIAHNLKFDERFLSSEFWRLGISFRPVAWQCTMEHSVDMLMIPNRNSRYGKYKRPSLKELLRHFNINEDMVGEYSKFLFGGTGENYHDSRFDTTAIYVVTNILREKLQGGLKWHNVFCK